MTLTRVLIANRGEIAVRVARACAALGVESVAVVSSADRGSLVTQLADKVLCIGPGPSRDSYLNIPALVTAARYTGSNAVHPGYGFLAEEPSFAQACTDAGLTFIGPPASVMRQVGNKLAARAIAQEVGVPVAPGSVAVRTAAEADRIAAEVGYPVLIKAASGGGGRGMRVVHSSTELGPQLRTASAEAESAFGDGTVYLERYIQNARHIEVQLLGDRHGHLIHLWDRDCSIQRRYQKIVEEAPATALPDDLREQIVSAAIRLGRAAGYENAGTVEFIVDMEREIYYFLEINARVQVEHPVTEAVTGVDIVANQILIASGDELGISQDEVRIDGHAIEARINAERVPGFSPSPGRLTQWQAPTSDRVRVDTHCYPGYVVPPYYDSLLAKVIGHDADRSRAVGALETGLADLVVTGVETTLPFMRHILRQREFRDNAFNTAWLPHVIEEFSEKIR